MPRSTERELEAMNQRLDERLDNQRRRLDTQRARIETVEAKVREWDGIATAARVATDVLQHQVSAIEERLEGLRSSQDAMPDSTDAARAEARDIVTAMRLEHAQVRAELQMLAAYEERIRRMETAIVQAARAGRLPEALPGGAAPAPESAPESAPAPEGDADS